MLFGLFLYIQSMKMKAFFLISSFFLSLVGYSQCPIIPSPVVYKAASGDLSIGSTLSINTDNVSEEMLAQFAKRLRDVYSIQTTLSSSSKQLKFKKVVNTPQDFYSITVQDNILITYSSEASCFYAINSLCQLIQGEQGAYYINNCFIQDYPKFQWRGLHLDVSRHFFTVEEVKRYIDLMSLYKFNTFHWHLTDDQGWRIEIKKYPKLTEVGAWRDSTVNAHYSTSPRTYTVERYGGFYTQEEVKEIVQYAEDRFITVVPEIEMPGHARAALAAYPEFSCTGQQLGVEGLWGVFDDIFCAHESSILFLKDVLDEVLELFPSTYIHIGGDEAPKTRWDKCPKCQAVIRENGLKDEHELQSYFIGEIDEYLTSKGRKLIGWDEILEGGLSPNAAVMSWRGVEGGIEAAKMHHYVVMSPGSHCYFDHYQSKNPNEPLAIGGFTPIEKVYTFNPVPDGLSPDEAAYILGGQANLWTEYIPNMQQLEYMTYPRALALAQALWCQTKPEYAQFEKVLVNYQLDFLKKYAVHFSTAMFFPEMEINQKMDGLSIHFSSNQDDYHFDLFVRSDEKIPSLSGGQVVGVSDSLYFERTSGNKIVNYSFQLSSENNPTPTSFRLKVHPAIGLPIDLVTQPDERYSGKGGLTLVDGVVGSLPWKGQEWLGFKEQEIEFIVDLERLTLIDSLQIGFLEDSGSWIYHPCLVRFSVSKNGKKWKYLKDADLNFCGETKSIGVHPDRMAKLNKKGRYVKVLISTFDEIPDGEPGAGHIPWTFIDEIMLFYK